MQSCEHKSLAIISVKLILVWRRSFVVTGSQVQGGVFPELGPSLSVQQRTVPTADHSVDQQSNNRAVCGDGCSGCVEWRPAINISRQRRSSFQKYLTIIE